MVRTIEFEFSSSRDCHLRDLRLLFQVDVRIVIAVSISLISAVQYYAAWNNYEEAIKYFVSVPKYR